MRLLISIPALILSLSSTALSLPTVLSPVPITQAQGPKKDGSYIIRLGDNVNKASTIQLLLSKLNAGMDTISYEYTFINGFAGKFSPEAIPIIQVSPGVEAIYEDAIWSINAVQYDATWGLERVNKPGHVAGTDPSALTYQYNYPDPAGANVDIYIVDTGININHRTFGTRAQRPGWHAKDFPSTNDGHGHGTHCAGTAAGEFHGVAKQASVIPVKVLSDEGSGTTSDIAAGLDWIIGQQHITGRPSVVSMSLGGLRDPVFDMAVENAVKENLHVVVAAGNSNQPAELYSPAGVNSVTTVGAWTIDEAKASFSNFGLVVDICAPGKDVVSSWIGPNNCETKMISGTSMATPHVAGVYALYLDMPEYASMAPEQLAEVVKQRAEETSDPLCPLVIQTP